MVSALLLFVLGCGIRVGNPDDEGDGDTSEENKPPPGTGFVQFSLTDAPIDNAAKVLVSITGLQVKSQTGGNWVEIPLTQDKEIDLLSLRDGVATDLAELNGLPVGEYGQVRLLMAEGSPGSIELTDGQSFDLEIPSGAESGLKLDSSFTVEDQATLSLILDFDVRKSVVVKGSEKSPNGFLLKPSLRLVDMSSSEVIILSEAGDEGDVICAYEPKQDVDVSDSCESSVTSTTVKADGSATLHYLDPGRYHLYRFDAAGHVEDLGERDSEVVP